MSFPYATDEPKVGAIVRAHLPLVFDFCAEHPDELDKLGTLEYSKATFGLGFAFLAETPAEAPKPARYWKEPHVVAGIELRVTSEWTKNHRDRFVAYLGKLGIAPLPAEEVAASTVGVGSSGGLAAKYAIGVTQNALVRHVLTRTAPPASKSAWLVTLEQFAQACAYCDATDVQLVADHVVAINMTSLGEHHLGNLVPACSTCNGQKSANDFRAFIQEGTAPDPEGRIARIEAHMAEHGYVPLRGNPAIDPVALQQAIDSARAAVQDVATRCIEDIKSLIATEA